MEDSVNIKELFRILIKRWWLIALFTIVVASLIGVITFFILTPKYEASTQILVNQKNSANQLDVSQMVSNIELINTYSVIIKSPAILGKVIDKLELKETIKELNKNIKINSQSESQVFSLTVRDTNPERAVLVANSISETFQQEIKVIMNVDNVSILAKAEKENIPIPVSPNLKLNIAIGVVAGLIMGIGLVFLLYFLDNSLKSSKDVEEFLDLPVLGSVHKIPREQIIKSIPKTRRGAEPLESRAEGKA